MLAVQRHSSHHTPDAPDSKMFLFIIHPTTCETRYKSTQSFFRFQFCSQFDKLCKICFLLPARHPRHSPAFAHSIRPAVDCRFVCLLRLNFPSKTKVSILPFSACNFLFVRICCSKKGNKLSPFLPHLNSSSFLFRFQNNSSKKKKTFCEK